MRLKSPFVPWLLTLLAVFTLTALPQDGDARRRRPAPRPRPGPEPATATYTVRCGPDIGTAKGEAVLVFGETKVALKNLRSVALVKRTRFTGSRANDKCCETVVTTEGALHTKDGEQLSVSGRAELPIEVDKATKTCTMDLTTDQVSSFHCYPGVVKQCPNSSHSKVEVLLMVF